MKFAPKNTFPIGLILVLLIISLFACKKESKYLNREKPEVVINANDARLLQPIINLVSDTVYVINTDLTILPNQTLKIAAGTLLKIGIGKTITVQPNGTIDAKGNADQPIVFTVNAFPGSAGGVIPGFSDGRKTMWKGLFINGNYTPTNDNTNSSGILSYVRIEFAGQANQNDNAVALLLKNVNKQTTINNIQVSYSETSSIKINGGNVNANNVVSYACFMTDIILQNQYQGMLQNILCFKHPYFFSGGENAGLRISQNQTFPIISNLSIIGPDNQKGFSVGAFNPGTIAISIIGGAKFNISNSAVLGYPSGAFKLNDAPTYDALLAGENGLSNSLFHSNIANDIFYIDSNITPPVNSDSLKKFLLKPVFKNTQYNTSAEFALTNPYDYYNTNSPDVSPAAGSPLLQGASFTTAPFTDAFFKKVSYRGALGAGADNWLQGWTNFNPLQTNYNF